MKNALILSGGAFKGAYQVGAVKELYNNGIKFDLVAGTSVGALNASLIAMDKFSVLEDLWKSVMDSQGGIITDGKLASIKDGKLQPDFKKIYQLATTGINKLDITRALISSSYRTKMLNKVLENLNKTTSILDNTPLKNLLYTHVYNKDFKIPCLFSMVSLENGWLLEQDNSQFVSDVELANAILASSTMPVIWEPIRIINTSYGRLYNVVDGGLRSITPLGQVFNFIEADKNLYKEDWTFWVINNNSVSIPINSKEKNLFNSATISIDILLNEIFNNDLDFTITVNKYAECTGKKKVHINIISPETGALGDSLDARPVIINQRIELGKLDTLKVLKNNGYISY